MVYRKSYGIGIGSITPIVCKRTFKKSLNYDRLQRIMISAIKQSGNAYLPILNQASTFDAFIGNNLTGEKFIGYCDPSKNQALSGFEFAKNTTVLIGPEGDFDPIEHEMAVSQGYHSISMGNTILRTETAALTFCANFQLNKK